MTSSLYLVLAFSVAQAPGDSPYATGYSQPSPAYQSVPVYSAQPQAQRPVRNWFRRVFSDRRQNKPCQQCMNQAQAIPTTTTTTTSRYYAPPASPYAPNTPINQPAMYEPVQQNLEIPVTTEESYGNSGIIYQQEMPPVITQITESPAPDLSKLHVAKKYATKVGHETDYSWITGHLFYVHTAGGRWVLRYSLPSEVDKYGGSVVLTRSVDMKNYREGDLVCVFGQILDEGRGSALGGALYRADTISLVERADP